MLNIKKILLSSLVISLISCSKECTLVPISENIFDLKKVNERNILNCVNEVDSIIFVDQYDFYTEKSFKGPMKYEECGHSKSYSIEFRNEPIQICLNKNEKKGLELSQYGWFNNLANNNDIIVK